MKNIENNMISIRQCTEPTKEVKQIYDHLKFKYVPYYRKKSVVPPEEIFKMIRLEIRKLHFIAAMWVKEVPIYFISALKTIDITKPLNENKLTPVLVE
ncbi:MAG: hypothetical protein J7J72_05660 [Bacteroidales bacterium]|nr:hypothetical protein [Bacteroidales bacterium]